MGKCLINGTNNNSKEGRAIQVMNFFVNKGLSPTQACAIAGNCYVESGKAYDPKSLNKNDCNASKTKCGPSYGLFQWHDVCTRKNSDGTWDESSCSGRFVNLKNYCKSNGLDYKTIGGQLAFLWHENAGNFQQYFSSNTNLSIDAYTQWWEKHWEVCGSCDHSSRLSEANRLAGLYKQQNKGECTVELTGGSGSGTGTEGGEFTCSESDNLDSSINLGEDSSGGTATGAEGEQTSTSNTNTVNKKLIFIGDFVGHSVWQNSTLKQNTRSFCKTEGKFNRPSVVATVKKVLSDKNNKPKSIIFYLGNGFDLSWAKSESQLRGGLTEWLYQISGAAGYTEIVFVSNVHPSKDVVRGTTNGSKGSYLYIMNQVMKEFSSQSFNNHAHYVELGYCQNTILDKPGYKKKSGNNYVFTNEALKLIGSEIWRVMPGACKW